MQLIEVYKGVKIEQHPEYKMFCGTFPKGSRYGWCKTIDKVKQKVDAVEATYAMYTKVLQEHAG